MLESAKKNVNIVGAQAERVRINIYMPTCCFIYIYANLFFFDFYQFYIYIVSTEPKQTIATLGVDVD